MNALKSLRLMLSLLFLVPGISLAQKLKNQPIITDTIPYNPILEKAKPGNPLSNYAFDKYIVNNFSFAILGSQAPTSGFKFETVKPSVSLTGNLHVNKAKTQIINLELTGGTKDGFMEVFSKNKTSGYFKAGFSYTFLTGKNSAGIKKQNDLGTVAIAVTNLQNKGLIDTVARIHQYVKLGLFHQVLYDSLFLKTPTPDNFKTLYLHYLGLMKYGEDRPDKKQTIEDQNFIKREEKLISKMLQKYGSTEDSLNKQMISFADRCKNTVTNMSKTDIEKKPDTLTRAQGALLGKNYNNGIRSILTARDSIANAEITVNGKKYSSMNLYWFNISSNVGNTSFQRYDKHTDTIFGENNFNTQAKLSFNVYKKNPDKNWKFWYTIFSVALRRASSIEELTSFSYKKSTAIKKGDVSINDEETGIAYKGDYKIGAGFDAGIETYFCDWESEYIPGVYFKAMYQYGHPWTNRNKIPLEVGLIYNFKSSSKESINRLSVIPYAAWSDLLGSVDPYDQTKVALHDKFSIGVKLGIPINIGK